MIQHTDKLQKADTQRWNLDMAERVACCVGYQSGSSLPS